MKKLELAYDRAKFWQDYWREHGIDHAEFHDLGMYPIAMTLRYVRSDHAILECGCGAGRVVRHLHSRGFDIVGLEYDAKIVGDLKQCDPELRLVEGDASRMPFSDNSFDVSLCYGTIGTMHTGMASALMELRRVTRPGGTVVLSVMLHNLARFMQKAINRVTTAKPREFYAWTDSERGWTAYLESFGLRVIDTEPMVSRYNIFYWAPLLRTRGKTDLTLARVDDAQFKLNPAGRAVWLLHRTVLRRQLAAAITFAVANDKAVSG